MQQAVALYENNRTILDRYNDGTMESFLDSYNEEIFDDLDKAFYAEIDVVSYTDYIRQNEECFGD